MADVTAIGWSIIVGGYLFLAAAIYGTRDEISRPIAAAVALAWPLAAVVALVALLAILVVERFREDFSGWRL